MASSSTSSAFVVSVVVADVAASATTPLPALFFLVLEIILSQDIRREDVDDMSDGK